VIFWCVRTTVWTSGGACQHDSKPGVRAYVPSGWLVASRVGGDSKFLHFPVEFSFLGTEFHEDFTGGERCQVIGSDELFQIVAIGPVTDELVIWTADIITVHHGPPDSGALGISRQFALYPKRGSLQSR
jgi:hypothetical protein